MNVRDFTRTCRPKQQSRAPLPEDEAHQIVASVSRYSLGADPAASVDLLSHGYNDVGNAQRLIAVCGDRVRFCTPMRKWLVWDGKRWATDELGQVLRLAQDAMLEFVGQAIHAQNETAFRFATQSLNTPRIRGLLSQAAPHLAVHPDALDSDPWLLNFANGTFDFQTCELRAHAREDFITKLVHHSYRPDAVAPRFLAFLERIVPAAAIDFLQKALGYSITGITTEKKIFFCMGPTNSGKTTLLTLMHDLFEEYSALIMMSALMQKDEDNTSRADLADLRGCRFAMTSETEEGDRLREAKLKRITQGQGRIKTARKYENPISFAETHKLWIDANHRPIVSGTDDAIWNRLDPIPFDHPLDEGEIDPELPQKLRAEAEGIIAWIVRGAMQWKASGLGRPPRLMAATKATWREEMDRLAAWRQECCDEGPDLQCQARPLYSSYREWDEDAGEHPMTETMFGRRMVDAGFKKRTAGRVTYLGIALKVSTGSRFVQS